MEELLTYINNFYYKSKEIGNFSIVNGEISVKNKYLKNQWIEIEGSILNDGIYKIEEVANDKIKISELVNEEFEGRIFSLVIPKALQDIREEIISFNSTNKPTNKTSYSFGGYSESVAVNSDGGVQTWQDIFKGRLRKYRNILSKEGQKRRIR